ncbi:hypothetical protein HZS_7625, partial [Henneguya salminicola]
MHRDRTSEFKNIVSNIQTKNLAKQIHVISEPPLKNRSYFLAASQKINEGIYSCYVKLENLGHLCKSRSLFDDRTDEINDLVYIIKLDVMHLKTQVEDLSATMDLENRNATAHGISHKRSILTSLEKKLAHVSKDFKSILEIRTE